MSKIVCQALVFTALLFLSSAAGAQEVTTEFRAGGGLNVEVVMTATAGGTVVVPAGTIVSSGDMGEQRFLIGQTIERRLEEGQTVTVTVPAYCLDYERDAASHGTPMQQIGVARGDIATLLAAATGSPRQLIQDALWALGSATFTASPDARDLLRRAGLQPKGPGQ